MERIRELIAELKRLAAMTQDAERQAKLLSFVDRLETGDATADEVHGWPLEPWSG